jgi:collagenase-like PrtC family protease
MILKTLDNGMNEVCVNSELMEQYIRENYPSYKIISSTTKRLASANQAISELKKDYFQVCLDYDLNHNIEFLQSIPKEDRSKVEFLTNAICRPKCPIRKQHYLYTGKAQKTWLREKYDVLPGCNIEHNVTHPSKLGKENNLSLEKIDEYNKMGFKYFKLEGRTLPSSTVFGCYLYYFIKPEAYFEVIAMASTQIGIFVNDPNGFVKGEVVIQDDKVNLAKRKI